MRRRNTFFCDLKRCILDARLPARRRNISTGALWHHLCRCDAEASTPPAPGRDLRLGWLPTQRRPRPSLFSSSGPKHRPPRLWRPATVTAERRPSRESREEAPYHYFNQMDVIDAAVHASHTGRQCRWCRTYLFFSPTQIRHRLILSCLIKGGEARFVVG